MKNLRKVLLVLLFLIVISSALAFYLFRTRTLNQDGIELIDDTTDLRQEFNLSENQIPISEKYQITCRSEKCSYSILFDTSKIRKTDRNDIKVFLRLKDKNDALISHSGTIDKDKIFFQILNSSPKQPLQLETIVVYNPSRKRVLSQ